MVEVIDGRMKEYASPMNIHVVACVAIYIYIYIYM